VVVAATAQPPAGKSLSICAAPVDGLSQCSKGRLRSFFCGDRTLLGTSRPLREVGDARAIGKAICKTSSRRRGEIAGGVRGKLSNLNLDGRHDATGQRWHRCAAARHEMLVPTCGGSISAWRSGSSKCRDQVSGCDRARTTPARPLDVTGTKMRMVEPDCGERLESITDSFHSNLTAVGLLSIFVIVHCQFASACVRQRHAMLRRGAA